MHPRIQHIAESIRADHAAGVNAHALSNLGARINGHVGKQVRALAEDGIGAHKSAGLQHAVGAKLHALFHRAVRPDMRRGINLCAGRNDGGGMNARRKAGFREKHAQRPGKRHPRVGHPDHDFARRRKFLARNDGGGVALLGGGEVLRVLGKGQVAGFGGVRRGKTASGRRSRRRELRRRAALRFQQW